MSRQPGYAIAEVLIAVVIISISFIQLSGAVSKIMRNANQTILMGKSIFVANSTLEEVMAQPFDAKGSEANDHALIFDGSGDYIDIGIVFNGIQTVSFWLELDDIGAINYIIDFDGLNYIRVNDGTLESNLDPSPKRNSYFDVSSGVEMIKISLMPDSIRVERG